MLKSVRFLVRSAPLGILAAATLMVGGATAPSTAKACVGEDCLSHCTCLNDCYLTYPEGPYRWACYQTCHDLYPCTSMPCTIG